MQKVMVLPELCLTGYTCSDLFWQERLLEEAREQLAWIAKQTKRSRCVDFPGAALGGARKAVQCGSRSESWGSVGNCAEEAPA